MTILVTAVQGSRPSKLVMRVRFPSPAPTRNRRSAARMKKISTPSARVLHRFCTRTSWCAVKGQASRDRWPGSAAASPQVSSGEQTVR